MSQRIILNNVPDYELEWAINKVAIYIKEDHKECVYTHDCKNFTMCTGIRRSKTGTIILNYWELHL